MTNHQDKELSSKLVCEIAMYGVACRDAYDDAYPKFEALADRIKELFATSPQLPVAEQPAGQAVLAASIVRVKMAAGPDEWDVKILDKSIPHGTLLYAAPHSPVVQMSGDVAQIIAELREEAHERRVADDTAGIFADEETAAQLEDWADRLAASHPSNSASVPEFRIDNRAVFWESKFWDLADAWRNAVGDDAIENRADEFIEHAKTYTAPAATVPQVVQAPMNWHAICKFAGEYAKQYTYDDGAVFEKPDDVCRHLLDDCVAGMLNDDDFRALFAPQPIAASPSVVPSDEQIDVMHTNAERFVKQYVKDHDDIFTFADERRLYIRQLLTTASNAGEAAKGEDK